MSSLRHIPLEGTENSGTRAPAAPAHVPLLLANATAGRTFHLPQPSAQGLQMPLRPLQQSSMAPPCVAPDSPDSLTASSAEATHLSLQALAETAALGAHPPVHVHQIRQHVRAE